MLNNVQREAINDHLSANNRQSSQYLEEVDVQVGQVAQDVQHTLKREYGVYRC